MVYICPRCGGQSQQPWMPQTELWAQKIQGVSPQMQGWKGDLEKKSLHIAYIYCLYFTCQRLPSALHRDAERDRGIAWMELHWFSLGYRAVCGKAQRYRMGAKQGTYSVWYRLSLEGISWRGFWLPGFPWWYFPVALILWIHMLQCQSWFFIYLFRPGGKMTF